MCFSWFGVAAAVAFIGTYSVVARWWVSAEGRTVVGVAATFAVNALYSGLTAAFPGAAWEPGVRTLVTALGGVLMLRLVALVWQAQMVTDGGRKNG
jgi:hypothetical protein